MGASSASSRLQNHARMPVAAPRCIANQPPPAALKSAPYESGTPETPQPWFELSAALQSVDVALPVMLRAEGIVQFAVVCRDMRFPVWRFTPAGVSV